MQGEFLECIFHAAFSGLPGALARLLRCSTQSFLLQGTPHSWRSPSKARSSLKAERMESPTPSSQLDDQECFQYCQASSCSFHLEISEQSLISQALESTRTWADFDPNTCTLSFSTLGNENSSYVARLYCAYYIPLNTASISSFVHRDFDSILQVYYYGGSSAIVHIKCSG